MFRFVIQKDGTDSCMKNAQWLRMKAETSQRAETTVQDRSKDN